MYAVWESVKNENWNLQSTMEQSISLEINKQYLHTLDDLKHSAITRLRTVNDLHDEKIFYENLPMIFLPTTSNNTKDINEQKAKIYTSMGLLSLFSSSIIDTHGRDIIIIRRKYEDNTGRLKAQYKRIINNTVCTMNWDRSSPNDDGKIYEYISHGTTQGFEDLWTETPFYKIISNFNKDKLDKEQEPVQEQIQKKEQLQEQSTEKVHENVNENVQELKP